MLRTVLPFVLEIENTLTTLGEMTLTNFAIIIEIGSGHSLAVVHGAADQYEALRVIRANGLKAVATLPVREVSDEIAALAPYPMWA